MSPEAEVAEAVALVALVLIHQIQKISGQLIIQVLILMVEVGIRIGVLVEANNHQVRFIVVLFTVLLVVLILHHYHKQVLQVQEQSTEVTH